MYVKTLENTIEFCTPPCLALTLEFGAESLCPKGHVSEEQAVDEVVGGVIEPFECGYKSFSRG